jgi:hypothetical protein
LAETIDTEKGAESSGGFAALDAADLGELARPAPAADAPPEAAAVEAGAADKTAPPRVPAADAVPEEAAADVWARPVGPAPGERAGRLGRFRLPGGGRLRLTAIGLAAMLAMGGGAVWIYQRHSHPPHPGPERPVPLSSEQIPMESPKPVGTGAPAVGSAVLDWEAVFRDIDGFRRRLSDQRDEILRLQRHYDYGIRELEEEAVRLIKETACGSLQAAVKHKPLELLLQGIQRRQGYRDALEQPLRRMELGNEELLFLERRARFDLQVLDVAQGVDMDAHEQAIQAAFKAHEPTAEALSIRGAQAPVALEAVWRRLAEQARQATFSADDRLNQDIVAEACAGNLARIAELTALTLKGASCLAEAGTQELFLNRVSQLTPLAAQKLSEWPGRWLCLNGLKRLSPETAKPLFAWSGECLSLNGLSELTPEVARHISGWRGRQLELMGLRKAAGVDALVEWEASGGKLFIAGDIRRETEVLRRPGGAPGRP